MAHVSRGAKDTGTDYGPTETVTNTKMNGDVNPIYAEFNGNIDNSNIKASAGIVGTKLAAGTLTDTQVSATAGIVETKIDDISSTDILHNTKSDPGSSASNTRPTDLRGEIRQLRKAIQRISIGDSAQLTNGTSSGLAADGTAAWFDGGVIGPSVAKNGSFLDNNAESSGPTAPYGWTVIDGGSGGPSTLVPVTLDREVGIGKAIHIVDSGAAGRDGIRQTISGLKKSSRYLVVFQVKPITGIFNLTTTGATGTFGNLALTTASGGSVWETLVGLIQTDATPTNIVVNLIAGASGAACHVGSLHVYPVGNDRGDRVNAPMMVRSAVSTNDGTSITTIETDTTVGVVVPGPGYHISVSGLLVGKGNGEDLQANGEIEESVNGGAWVVRSKSSISENAPGNFVAQKHIGLMYDDNAPTPGSLYEYRLTATVGFQSGASNFAFDGSAGSENHRIRVTLTKV